MLKWMITEMGPVTVLFAWLGERRWVLHLDWPASSETGVGKWAW